jgi:replicative DNA helicase
MLERTPPHNIDAEKAVLGSMILDNSTIQMVDGLITAEDFYHEPCKKIFKAIEKNHKKPIDILILCDILRESGQLDSCGGVSVIAELPDNIPSAANIVYYANIVKENSVRRRLLEAAYEITNMAFAVQEPLVEIIDKSQKQIMAINPVSGGSNISTAKEIAKQTFTEIEARSKSGLIVGLSTGLRDIDDITGGLHKGELTIIAGRPGMGKSCLAVNIAHAAGLRGEASLINSIEMPNETLMIRMLSPMAQIENRNLRRGFIRGPEWEYLAKATTNISECPIYFDDSPNITPGELRQRARKAKQEYDIKLLVLDYMQIMHTKSKGDRREQEVAEISRTLKGIARELNIPVIGVSQLNRQVDQRPDKRPMLSDLRESGAIEQDADLILFIYRDEVYNKSEDNPEKGMAEIIIGKNRHGDTPVIKTVFLAKYQQFRDLQREENAPWRRIHDR